MMKNFIRIFGLVAGTSLVFFAAFGKHFMPGSSITGDGAIGVGAAGLIIAVLSIQPWND